MINHPNRSKRQPRVRVVLSNAAGPLDEMVVAVHRDATDEALALETARTAASLILAAEFLYPGDTITVSEIER
jgi:hypothetical protein